METLPVKLLEWLIKQPEFSIEVNGEEAQIRIGDSVSALRTGDFPVSERIKWLTTSLSGLKTALGKVDQH